MYLGRSNIEDKNSKERKQFNIGLTISIKGYNKNLNTFEIKKQTIFKVTGIQ